MRVTRPWLSRTAARNPGEWKGRRMTQPDQFTTVISLADAAAQLGVHQRTVSRAIARGELAATRRGRRLEISRASLERFATRTRQRGRAGLL